MWHHPPSLWNLCRQTSVISMSSSASTETLSFIGSQGAPLAGVLHRPDGTAKGSVLLAHCFTCSKDVRTLVRLAKGLAEAGYAVLRFDFTGLGESGGEFAEHTVSGDVGDLTRAATTLIERGFGPCVLIGHSLGGAAALLAAKRLKTVRSIVTIAAPSSVEHVTHLFADQLPALATDGRAVVTIAGRSFELEQGFVDDLEHHSVLEAAAHLGRPYLVVHAKDDTVVGYDQGVALYEAAAEPKAMLSLETGGHLLGPIGAAEEALEGIVAWLDEPAHK